MKVSVERVREHLSECWECYNPDIKSICHHCGRLLCGDHRYILQKDPEFKKIPELESASHCEECYHPSRSFIWLIMTGIILTIIGFFWLKLVAVGIAVICVGGVLHYFYNVIKTRKLLLSRKAGEIVPLIPDLDISVNELVNCDFNITKDDYLSVKESRGAFDIKATLSSREEGRYDAFRLRYKSGNRSKLHFGFLAIDNMKNIRFHKDINFLRENVIPLQVSDVSGIEEKCRKQEEIHFKYDYDIQKSVRLGPKWDEEFPLWIRPSIGIGDGTILNIEVRLSKELPEYNGNGQKIRCKIINLNVNIPPELIAIEETFVNGEPGGRIDRKTNQAVWRDITVEKDEKGYIGKIFNIKFKKPISGVKQIEGNYRVELNNYTISDTVIKKDQIWTPSGLAQPSTWAAKAKGPILGRRGKRVEMKTEIFGDIYIDTSLLPMRREHTESKTISHEGVIPDHETANVVVKALTDEDVYVKRAKEMPSRVSKTRANIRNRYWDIIGRKYCGTYGMDVHVVLSGNEVYEKEPVPCGGESRVELTIRGQMCMKDMEEIMKRTCLQLASAVDSAMKKQREKWKGKYAEIAKIGKSDEIKKVEEMLEKIEQSLIDGKISKEIYEELKDKYQRRKEELEMT